ncbi:transposase-like protein [Pseudomonas nitritireducens]|uniref:Transposase-like protein n=1 Tax=Pseudomonas nitroreducens TaxID=46680 RepID=A0A7W7KF57_PSENT|nr:hypothetical protein [Pseudomonas nitritireducens]MBB4861659.1 transposase-like protein [Pseudomonas nitritireducens]
MNATDVKAVEIMTSNLAPAQKQERLAALAGKVAVAAGSKCPECDHDGIEDNGLVGAELEYRCTECDHRWGAE